ncbi:hypothetical protein V1502_10230 [Bacillus sp. SCS-153A]|uniref:hypothetical protein n=1 Tax=Rossellomorea sedimentorum TaxID=3115294 RepID=UPI00390651B7
MKILWVIAILLASASVFYILYSEKAEEIPPVKEEPTETVFHEVLETDVVQLRGKQYYSYPGIVSDPADIGEKIGEVKANVFEKASGDPAYQLRDGDASFLPEGTHFYQIRGLQQFIAAESADSPTGFKIYQEVFKNPDDMDFDNIANQNIKKIEIYKVSNSPILENTLLDEQRIYQFLDVLRKGQVHSNPYKPQVSGPTFYQAVFYSEEPVAEVFAFAYDGTEWYSGHHTFKGLERFISIHN